MRAAFAALTAAALARCPDALAHAGGASAMLAWTFEPWVIGTIVGCAMLYAAGLRNLRKRGWRGTQALRAGSFAAGLAVLVFALVSPLDALGAELFAAHMTQHELLMLVAAPLLVCGRPLATWLWALPRGWRAALGATAKAPAIAWTWAALTAPIVAWIQHAAVLWIWHAPSLFDAALADRGVHTLQHISFLASALVFWWALLPRPGTRATEGALVVYLFTTMLQTGALGALLTLSSVPWYPWYLQTTLQWGLTPLEDQQLGGLIMWIPAGAVYAAVALMMLAVWLRSSEPALAFDSSDRRHESTSRGRDTVGASRVRADHA